MSGWFYMKTGVFNDEQVGPVDDGTLLQLALDGKVGLKTLITHAANTKGQWVHLERLPAVKKQVEGSMLG